MKPHLPGVALALLQTTACSSGASGAAAGPTVATFHESLQRCLDGTAVTLYGGGPGTVDASSTLEVGATTAVTKLDDAASVKNVAFRISFADPAFVRRIAGDRPTSAFESSSAKYRQDGDRYVFDATQTPTTFHEAATLMSLGVLPQVSNAGAVLNAHLRQSCPPVALGATS